MTKEQFIKRCETIYDMGLATNEVLRLMSQWTEAIMRLEGGQTDYFVEVLARERKRTNGFAGSETLANDNIGYKVIQLNAVLVHPCQKCGEDKTAWHTRTAYCDHQ